MSLGVIVNHRNYRYFYCKIVRITVFSQNLDNSEPTNCFHITICCFFFVFNVNACNCVSVCSCVSGFECSIRPPAYLDICLSVHQHICLLHACVSLWTSSCVSLSVCLSVYCMMCGVAGSLPVGTLPV
jgi:hypothetical protein